MPPLIDLTGQRFGRLVVLYRVASDEYGKSNWMCRCDCGNEKAVLSDRLRRGVTTSCGCSIGPNKSSSAAEREQTQTKTCSICLEEKPLSEFGKHANKPDGHQSQCKSCVSWLSKEKRYGINRDDFDRMLIEQDYQCGNPGCSTSIGIGFDSVVDHCHGTKHVRSILCRKCNTALGMLGENVGRMMGLALYIQQTGIGVV